MSGFDSGSRFLSPTLSVGYLVDPGGGVIATTLGRSLVQDNLMGPVIVWYHRLPAVAEGMAVGSVGVCMMLRGVLPRPLRRKKQRWGSCRRGRGVESRGTRPLVCVFSRSSPSPLLAARNSQGCGSGDVSCFGSGDSRRPLNRAPCCCTSLL